MRRFQGYCIGAPRSGTHSVAQMFEKNFRSAHEPLPADTIRLLLYYLAGGLPKAAFFKELGKRDAHLQLEMESNHCLHHVSKELSDLFPEAKFIATVRDPMTWVESEINRNIFTGGTPNSVWIRLEAFRYGRYGVAPPPREKELAKWHNVWPLETYFRYWADHYRSVLDNVPQDRLMVVPMREMEQRVEEMCRFLCAEIEPNDVDLTYVHSGQAPRAMDLEATIERDYVREIMEKHCGEIISRLTGIAPSFMEDTA